MGLFTNPVVLNDGTADKTFSFRAQLPDKKAVVGEWIEAGAPLAEDSKIIAKHDTSSPTVRRRLLQRVTNALLADGVTRKPVTCNITVTYNPLHPEADVAKVVRVITDAVAEPTFVANFLRGLI